MAAAARRYDVSELAAFTYTQYKLILVLVMTQTPKESSTKTVCLVTCLLCYQIAKNMGTKFFIYRKHLDKLCERMLNVN